MLRKETFLDVVGTSGCRYGVSQSFPCRIEEVIVPFGELNGVPIAVMARSGVISKSRCLKEKHYGSNFNDWFRSPKMVLRVEKKLYVIEQPISPAPPTDTTAQMKGYVEQLERLGYVLSQDISVGLILNGLTSDFVGFVRNYNMHNMGKTIGKLHALLIEYEKGLPKKAATPQVMAIQGGRTRKPIRNRLMLKAKGCKALVKRDTPNKLQRRSIKCIFIGYPKETVGYYFYFLPKNKIVVAWYAGFLEKNLLSQEVSGRAEELEEDKNTSPSENTKKLEVEGFEPPQDEVVPIHRSARTHRAPDCLCLNWVDAMNAEMQSMKDNHVWCLVDLSLNCKTVGIKWIFKKKTDMDGIVHTYKARLVAKGYTQTYGVDYEETFSPVADIRAIESEIALARSMTMRYGKWMSKLPF
ncbi:retrotransposon protein, putative, ty1-copia subclass [Tanacetum coccineum]